MTVLQFGPTLFGLAAGPFIAGVVSDVWGLTAALTAMSAFGLLAALACSFAARTYAAEMRRAGQPIDEPTSTPIAGVRNVPEPAVGRFDRRDFARHCLRCDVGVAASQLQHHQDRERRAAGLAFG